MKKGVLVIISIIVILVSIAIGTFYVNDTDKFPFSLGLDLAGGAQLTYTANTDEIPDEEISGRLDALQQVIERRVNSLGVSEPRVFTSSTSIFTGLPIEHRLLIELPGVTDIEEAIRSIGETPHLEFKLYNSGTGDYDSLPLQSGNISSASVQFLQGPGGALTSEPTISLSFDGEGSRLFADITRQNVGRLLGIFIDGELISAPVIREAILGGTTQISGSFTLESAKSLADNLNLGALPIPIELSETRTVNPTLGVETISKSAFAGLIALALILLMFLIVYRFTGVVAALALGVYIVIVLSIFKIIPIVLTAAGLAGFIMSMGFAVDANVLIFERMREELKNGTPRNEAIKNGCARAWLAIRDANFTSIIIAFLLFWFGSSLIKGFAFAFIIGVAISMISAYVLTKIFLYSGSGMMRKKLKKWYIG